MTKTKEKQNIPKGWVSSTVSDLCDNLDNKRIPVTKADRVSGDIPYYGATGIIDYVDDHIFDDEILLIGEDGADWSAFANTSFLVSGKSWVNNHAHVLKCKDGVLGPYLKEYFNWKNLDYYTTGGTRKKLNKVALMNVPVVLPESKKEQQKIAEVLGAVDEEIEKTKEVIKATEKLKKGLMQQLFTRGIGHTKFKRTELGEIPESWSVTTVRNSSLQLIDGDRGTNYPKRNDFLDEGYCLFLSAKNVTKGGFVFDELSFITKEKDEALRKGKLERGDIILTSRGTVGNVAIYDESVRYEHIRINSGMLIFRHGKDFIPEFLYWYLTSPQMQSAFKKMGSGSAQPQLPVGSLELIPVLVIPEEEQEKISETISSVHKKISVNKKLLAKQTELKKGLMQDLLSGVKRVRA